MAEENKKIESIRGNSKSIKQLLDRVVAWENYWRILRSKNLLSRLNRKWRALYIARRLRYTLIENIIDFEQSKAKTINAINQDNQRLADRLAKFIPEQETAVPNLGKLLAAFGNLQFAEHFINTHADELIKWVNSLENDEYKDEMRKLIIEVSGAEIAEINRCIADLEAWQSLRIGNDIQFFRNRVKLYVGGGKIENREFAGLGKFFKDWDLIKLIKESAALRMLLKYQTQLQWFDRARKIIAYSILKGGWEGFSGKPNGLYYNLKEGKEYIEMVRHVFGNKDAANYLEGVYNDPNGPGEVPKLWLPHFDEILARIKNPTYINTDVIMPARDDLIRIFSRRKEELAAINVRSRLIELERLLRIFFKKAVKRSKNLARFDALLAGEQKLLEREINAEKRRFINVLLDHGEAVIDFVGEQRDEIDNKEKDINYYIGAYVYLAGEKLKALAQRLRGASLFEAFEKADKVEEKEKVIVMYAAKELKAAAAEAAKSQSMLSEIMKKAGLVDGQMKIATQDYYTINGKTILEVGYLT